MLPVIRDLRAIASPVLFAVCIAAATAISSAPARANPANDRGSEPASPFRFDVLDKEEPFEPGHGCGELTELGDAELKAALSDLYQADFHAFCRPEEPSVCSDYTGALKGLGHMATGDDGWHCRFIPNSSADTPRRR